MSIRRPRGALAWAFYDVGNTVYSLAVVTLFFPTWVTVDRGREDLWFSVFFGASMLAVALIVPYLGLWSDRGRRLWFLGVFTGTAVAATACLALLTRIPGTTGLILALGAFAVSNFGFQGGLVFYNALLSAVSTHANRGRISGLGVGLGYVGALIALLCVVPFVDGVVPLVGWRIPFIEAGGRPAAFLPAAVLFLVFAAPLFVWVREPRGVRGSRPSWRRGWRSLLRTLRNTRRYPGVPWFLAANFLVLDAIHTAMVFIAVYAEKVLGMDDSAKAVLFLASTVPAVVGSFLAGWVSDRFGARKVFLVTAWLWVVCPLGVALARNPAVLYALGGVIGLLLGSLWTTTRPLLLSLIPAGQEGRAFGLYAFSNKSAAVLGPQLWGLTVLLAEPLGNNRYRIAIVVLSGLAALGALLAHRIPDPGKAGGRGAAHGGRVDRPVP